MSQTVTISDNLYRRLETEVQRRGLHRIEDLLELWTPLDTNELQRREVVRQIQDFRERMRMQYGEAIDSVELIRADRMR